MICAPGFSGSAGNRVLYMLRDVLRERGFDARVYNWNQSQDTDITFSEITEDMQREAIVVYPEIIIGNPLGFHRVVRWVLNVPGALGGSTSYHLSEMIFTWSSAYLAGVPLLRFDTVDHSLFYKDPNQVKDVICTFVYKKGKFRDIPEDEGAIQISRTWPTSRAKLAELLRRTRVLYSYDDNSSLLEEAYASGAQVKIVTETGYKHYSPSVCMSPDIVRVQIDNFVSLTQSNWNVQEVEKLGCCVGTSILSVRVKRRVAHLLYKLTGMNCWRESELVLAQAVAFMRGDLTV